MTDFFNDHHQIVSEALLGFVKGNADSKLELLDSLPHIKCVFSSDRDPSKVTILSGGGSGHEPAHAGFVGNGMLTGAILGEIFASPSVDAVLAAILHASGDAGCLLILKNYTGDRLSFGLAAERAKNLGVKVEMIIVGDDISIPGSKQPRGVAGTLFVHKMAGYYAEQGLSLSEIKTRIDAFKDSICSIGVAYETCRLPGANKPTRVQATAELGLGIHGEAGRESFEPISSKDTIRRVVDVLKEHLPTGKERIAVLVNNLGGTSNLEMSVIVNDLLESEFADNIELISGPQTYMTALNMHGFSISMIPLNDEIRTGLTAPTEVKAFLPFSKVGAPKFLPLSPVLSAVTYKSSENEMVSKLIEGVSKVLLESEDLLNELDAKVGDGDTGSTFAKGAKAIIHELHESGLPLNDAGELFLSISHNLSVAMGGSSGVLLSIFFTAAGNHYAKNKDLIAALNSGLEMVSLYGGAKKGDRTMLDAAIPAIESLINNPDINQAAIAAELGADATAEILNAKAGRSSYLRSESLVGVKDPGAVAISLIFRKISDVINNK